MLRLAKIACYCLLWCGWALTAAGAAPRHTRIYVQPFALKLDAQKIRKDVIEELRKLNLVAIVASPAAADEILTGSGEIWVRGYVSLNPRSGRLPTEGTPLYGGYLSAELRDRKGDILWSYLVAPGAPSSNIAHEISKQLADHIGEELAQHRSAGPVAAGGRNAAVSLHGAGSTFPAPIYDKWFESYSRLHPSIRISYDAVGSEAGISQLLAGKVDFGASDSPGILGELAPGSSRSYLFLPSVIGAVVPIVNLPGYTGTICFTPEILAGIYLGTITRWDDPLIQKANGGAAMPAREVVVIHRADGSGTTYTLADYLSKTVPEWKARIGTAISPKWPVGRGASGNEGVARLVGETEGAIGYVEYIYALRNHLAFGKLRNGAGTAVLADLASIAAAARNSAKLGADFRGSIVNAPGADAYPLASFTWFVFPAQIGDRNKKTALIDFLNWVVGPGQKEAAGLGYVALPEDVVRRERAEIAAMER